MARRVVVTGMGTVSPLGHDLPTTWDGIVKGRSGIAEITHFDTTDFRTTIAAEVKDFDPLNHFSVRDVRRMDPFVQYALVAAREAVADAQITFQDGLGERTAVILGSGIGGMTTVTEQNRVLLERGPGRISPLMIPMILPESGASMVSIEFGLRGPNMAVTSACATGANAIGEAYCMIKQGIAEVALCGGSEKGVIATESTPSTCQVRVTSSPAVIREGSTLNARTVGGSCQTIALARSAPPRLRASRLKSVSLSTKMTRWPACSSGERS